MIYLMRGPRTDVLQLTSTHRFIDGLVTLSDDSVFAFTQRRTVVPTVTPASCRRHESRFSQKSSVRSQNGPYSKSPPAPTAPHGVVRKINTLTTIRVRPKAVHDNNTRRSNSIAHGEYSRGDQMMNRNATSAPFSPAADRRLALST